MSSQSFSNLNLERAHQVLKFCLDHGVKEVVLCAGARNAPLVELIESLPVEVFRQISFFEERSAAFYALGRIEATGQPVAVITTSGTAVAELLPATIEAHYQGKPLLLLTADRPRRFRGSGSPQSLLQTPLLASHVDKVVDFEGEDEIPTWNRQGPLHFNVCFEEPQSHRADPDRWAQVRESLNVRAKIENRTLALDFPPDSEEGASADPLADKVVRLITEARNPLVILGPLSSRISSPWRTLAAEIAHQLRAPVYAETLSGLTGDPKLRDSGLIFSEDLAQFAAQKADLIIRIGAVPTCRLWRDLEEKLSHLSVVNLVTPQAAWSGLARQAGVTTLVLSQKILSGVMNPSLQLASEVNRDLDSEVFKARGLFRQQMASLSMATEEFFRRLCHEYPRSEVAMLQALSQLAQDRAALYLGNSLSIREWDWIAKGQSYPAAFGHRGVNGIDGQVASFLGWGDESQVYGAAFSLAVLGDLTAMYDLAALALTPQLRTGSRWLVVVNNGGGMIFKKIFKHELFLNRHEFEFKGWAEMFHWQYDRVDESSQLRGPLEGERRLTELRPDSVQSDLFNNKWREWVQSHPKDLP